MEALRSIVCLIGLAVGVCGCASYSLGPTNGVASGTKSVQIASFSNDTLEPRISGEIVSALRKALARDGTYRLNTSGEGDILLTGVVSQFLREAVSFQPNDILTARDFRIRVVARVIATDRTTGKTIFDGEVEGRTSLRAGLDLPSTERQAMPLAAADLAGNVTSMLVDGVW